MKPIVRHAVGYVSATYAFQMVTLVIGLVTKRYLGPANVGIWASCGVLTTYLAFASLGITDSAQKEIAYLRARGSSDEADNLRDVMFTVWMAASIVLAIVVITVTAAFRHRLPAEYYYAVCAVVGLFPVSQLAVCYTVMLRCHKQFSLLSKTLVILASLNIIQIPLTIRWGFHGFVIAYAIVQIANVAYWWRASDAAASVRFRIRWDWSALRHLLRQGFPIQVGGVAINGLRTLDQVILLAALGPAQLGFYSIGVSMNNFVYNLPKAVSVVTFPNFQEKFGREGITAVLGLVVKPVLLLSFIVLPVAVGAAYQFLPPLIRTALPQFIPGITAAQVLAMGTFALSLNNLPIQLLITVNRQWLAVVINIAGVAMLAGLVYAAIAFGRGIVGIAAATAVSYALSSAALLLIAGSVAGAPASAMRLVVQCAAAYSWTWGALAVVAKVHLFVVHNWISDFLSAFIGYLAYLLLLLPLAWYIERREGLLSEAFPHLKPILQRTGISRRSRENTARHPAVPPEATQKGGAVE